MTIRKTTKQLRDERKAALEAQFARLVPDKKLRDKLRPIIEQLGRIAIGHVAGSVKSPTKRAALAKNLVKARAVQMTPEWAEWRKERAMKGVAARRAKAKARAEAEAKAKQEQNKM